MNERAHEGQVVVHAQEVAVSAKSQRLVECILEVTMRRFHVSVFMRLADVDSMAAEAVVCEQIAVRCGGLFVV